MKPSYSTPQATFNTWKYAASVGDHLLLVETYAESSKDSFRKQLNSTSHEALVAMQEEASDTEFTIQKVVYEDRRAYVRVLRERDGQSDIEIINMIKEGDDWKLIP